MMSRDSGNNRSDGRGRTESRGSVRSQIADDLGIDEDQITVQERSDRVETSVRDEGRRELQEQTAAESDFLEPDDVTVDDDGIGVDAFVSDRGQQRARARQLEEQTPLQDIDPDRIELGDEGPEPTEGLQRDIAEAQVDRVASQLPDERDIAVPVGDDDFERVAGRVAGNLGSGRLERLSRVETAAGREGARFESTVQLVEDLDPQAAEEFLNLEPETVEAAQDAIEERRETLEEDPERVVTDIQFRGEDFFDQATAVAEADRLGARERRSSRQRAEAVESQLVESTDLTPEDVDVSAGPSGVGLEQDLTESGRDRVAQRQIDATGFDQLDTSDVDVEFSQGGIEAQIDETAAQQAAEQQTREELRTEVAEETGADPSDVVVEQDDGSFEATLSEDFLEDERRRQEEEIRGELVEEIDDELPDIDIAEDDIQFEETEDGIEATLDPSAFDDGELGQQQFDTDVNADQTEQDPTGLDRLREPLEDASSVLNPRLRSGGRRVGSAVATVSPIDDIERVLRPDADAFDDSPTVSGRAIEGLGEGAAEVLDVPGIAAGGIAGAQFLGFDGSQTQEQIAPGVTVTEPTAARLRDEDSEVEAEIEAGATAASAAGVEAFQEDPARTTGRGVGLVAGGVVIPSAAARGAQQATRAQRGVDIDFEDFRAADRAQLQRGRQRDRDSGSSDNLDDLLDSVESVDPEPDSVSGQTSFRPEFDREADIPAARVQDRRQERRRTVDDRSRDRAFQRTMDRETTAAERVAGRQRLDDITPGDDLRVVASGERLGGQTPLDDLRTAVDIEDAAQPVEAPRSTQAATVAGTQADEFDSITGSPTLTGEQTPETGQTLQEAGTTTVATGAAIEATDITEETSLTAPDTQLRQAQEVDGFAASFDATGFEASTDVATRPATDSGLDIGSDAGLGGRTDTPVRSGIDTGLGINGRGATTTDSRVGTRPTATTPTASSTARTQPTQRASRPGRAQRVPRAPDIGEPEDDPFETESFDDDSFGIFEERTVRDLEDPDFLQPLDDLDSETDATLDSIGDPTDDIPDPTEGL